MVSRKKKQEIDMSQIETAPQRMETSHPKPAIYHRSAHLADATPESIDQTITTLLQSLSNEHHQEIVLLDLIVTSITNGQVPEAHPDRYAHILTIIAQTYIDNA